MPCENLPRRFTSQLANSTGEVPYLLQRGGLQGAFSLGAQQNVINKVLQDALCQLLDSLGSGIVAHC